LIFFTRDAELINVFYNLSNIGRFFFPSVALLFGLVFSGKTDFLKKWYSPLILYFPSLIFFICDIICDEFVLEFIFNDFGWVPIIKLNSSVFLFYSFFIIYVSSAIILVIISKNKNVNGIQKKSTSLIINASLIVLILNVILDVILPITGKNFIPFLAPVIVTIWITTIVIGIMKYKFLNIVSSFTMESIIDSMTDFLIITDIDGITINANKQFYETTSYLPIEIEGKPYGDIIEENIKNMIISEDFPINNNEFTIRTKSGEEIPVRISKSVIINKENEKVGFSFICRDLRDEKRMLRKKIEIEKKEEEIRNLKNEFELFSDYSNEAFILLSMDGKILSFNKAGKKMMNILYKKDISRNMNINDIFEDQNEKADFYYVMDKVCEGEVNTEKSVISESGQISYYRFDFSPIIKDNKVECVMIIAIDFSDIKRVEKQVINMLELEKELNNLRSQFIHTVSHEFRTPLGGISSSVELLERYYEKWDPEKRKKTFRQIYDSVNYITNLLDDIFLFGKNEQLVFNPTETDFENFCKDAISNLLNILRVERKINICVNFEVGKIMADKSLLKLIITNLISNAIKYSSSEKEVDFTISRLSKDKIYIMIRDRGIGISQKDLENIFKPFHRGENVENIKGTGLGMSIIKKAVDLHGGSIEIESNLGAGTTIMVFLPYISI